MNERRDRVFAAITRILAVLLLIPAWLRSPGHARRIACGWALSLRFPAERLTGLTEATLTAFTAARTEAFWRHHTLIGVTSGHRDAAEQHRLFLTEVARTGSERAARRRVLPVRDSVHVRGIALDIRPREGAQWLEDHGSRFGLYRTYDNEWWHFEHRPDGAPTRLPHPGLVSVVAPFRTPR
ncbi:M15 family metallopeptidase [Amycolatopsis sp. lyj-112]|uniref:M15 family metallopeptidase n=1 Tax=Amycolatopsis sp. lyj-112 TaxID=2789288 RepID=UPI00397BAB78